MFVFIKTTLMHLKRFYDKNLSFEALKCLKSEKAELVKYLPWRMAIVIRILEK